MILTRIATKTSSMASALDSAVAAAGSVGTAAAAALAAPAAEDISDAGVFENLSETPDSRDE